MIDKQEEIKVSRPENPKIMKPKDFIKTKSCLNEELQEFLKANSSTIEPDDEDTEMKRIVLKPKKVVSTSLNKQRGVNKKHVHVKTIKN